MVVLALVVLIPLCAYALLFEFNRFDLVIRVEGSQYMELPENEQYVEPGVEIRLVGSQFFRKGIPVSRKYQVTGKVDESVPGVYHLAYYVDWWMWQAQAERSVQVLDMTPPVICLTSDPNSCTIYGEMYEEEGYSAWDKTDGDVTQRVIREEKDGIVTYSVSDEAGNRTTVSRKICYVDHTSPVLTLLGGDTVTVISGEGYVEPGWTAQDNWDGDLSDQVKVEGHVDKYLAGSYQLTYTTQDRSGNQKQAVRTVIVEPQDQPATVAPEGNVIYLTFDDGPCAYTDWLLQILDKYEAKATFFVVNTDSTDILSHITEKGHAIGIHSVSHKYREIYASPDAYFHDILTMQKIIYENTGVMTYLMRFPGGSSNTVSCFNEGIMTYLTQAVEDMGFRYFDWNVDSNDAGGAKNAKEVSQNVIGGVQGRRISIVLQHDIKPFSVEAVEKILRWGKANGYQFLPLDMTSPTAHHSVNN